MGHVLRTAVRATTAAASADEGVNQHGLLAILERCFVHWPF